jgi:hypothetical protein
MAWSRAMAGAAVSLPAHTSECRAAQRRRRMVRGGPRVSVGASTPSISGPGVQCGMPSWGLFGWLAAGTRRCNGGADNESRGSARERNICFSEPARAGVQACRHLIFAKPSRCASWSLLSKLEVTARTATRKRDLTPTTPPNTLTSNTCRSCRLRWTCQLRHKYPSRHPPRVQLQLVQHLSSHVSRRLRRPVFHAAGHPRGPPLKFLCTFDDPRRSAA